MTNEQRSLSDIKIGAFGIEISFKNMGRILNFFKEDNSSRNNDGGYCCIVLGLAYPLIEKWYNRSLV
jgi:hypothetical protein